jgi:hypothetical protein
VEVASNITALTVSSRRMSLAANPHVSLARRFYCVIAQDRRIGRSDLRMGVSIGSINCATGLRRFGCGDRQMPVG